jgi:hypothetical protein
MATVWVLKVPRVERPSSDWNIQKKLLLTWGTKRAPEPAASATRTTGTPRLPAMGARMPAAVIADTEIEPSATCRIAAISQTSSSGGRNPEENAALSMSASPEPSMTAPSDPLMPERMRIGPQDVMDFPIAPRISPPLRTRLARK